MADNQRPSLAGGLCDEGLCRAFYCFLAKCQREAHLLFWLEAEEFRFLVSPEREARTTELYYRYFHEGSESYLNMEISDCMMESVSQKSPQCFESAQHTSFIFLSGLFDAFLGSDIYAAFLALCKSSGGDIRKSTKRRRKKMKTGNNAVDRMIKKHCQRQSVKRHSAGSPRDLPNSAETDITSPGRGIKLLDVKMQRKSKSKSLQDLTRSFSEDQIVTLEHTFCTLLFSKPYLFVRVLLETASAVDRADEVCQCIVDIFLQNSCISELLRCLFEQEISQFTGTNKAVLFRTDSPATMVMSKYLNRIGHSYLDAIVSPIFHYLLHHHPTGLEVDLAPEDAEARKNTAILLQIAENLLDRVVHSASDCPRMLKKDLSTIYSVVEDTFKQTGLQVLGSLLFLRFICPAIVSPARFNLSEGVPPKIQRSCVLISKMLQNLVNGVEFDGSKEHYMTKLNPFLSTSNRNRLSDFMFELMDDENGGILVMGHQLVPEEGACKATLVEFVIDHFDELWQRVIVHPQLAMEFFPFFKVGLNSVRSFLSDNSLGHL